MKHNFIKNIVAIFLIFVTAADIQAQPKLKISKEELAQRKERRQKEFLKFSGGYIHDTRNQKGSVCIIDAQDKVKEAWLQDPMNWLRETMKIKLDVIKGVFDFNNVAISGNLSIFLIENPTMPALLVAPENKWAAINVTMIATQKESFFKARLQKELTRAFAMLCGASMSNYDNPITGFIGCASDLDNITDYRLPMDILTRCKNYLESCNVTSYKRTMYRKAVEEGWAPAPTNDIQKAVWDEVRAAPKNPMKIEFDPKKGR